MLELSRVRRSALLKAGDTWADIAERELPGVASEEAVSKLQSWNLHVFMRASIQTAGQNNPILPSDVIFLEPPAPRS